MHNMMDALVAKELRKDNTIFTDAYTYVTDSRYHKGPIESMELEEYLNDQDIYSVRDLSNAKQLVLKHLSTFLKDSPSAILLECYKLAKDATH